MAAENIFSQYAKPVRSVVDYMGDMDAQDMRKQQLVGAQRQNALAALVAQQQQKTMAETAADNNAFQALAKGWTAGTTDEDRVAGLRNSGRVGLQARADALEKQALERGKLKSENGKRDTETENAVVSQWRDMIGMAVSPEHAAKMVAAMHADPRIASTPMAKVPLDQAMAMLQQTPFDQWKQQFALGATKFVEMNKPQYVTQDLGGSSQITALPGLGAGPAVVASATPKTQTLESIASNETQRRGQNMTDARAREKNAIDQDAIGKVDWKQDTDGNWIALPKEVKSGEPVVPVRTTVPGKKEIQAGNALGIIQEARKLLDKGTGSYVGAGVDQAARAVGMATGGAVATAQLKALEGALMMAQPRMEGPQSNLDVSLYRQMAAQIGDPTVPAEMKKAALDSVEALHRKYAPNAPKAEQSGAAKVTNDAEYNALPSGTTFVGPDGKTRRKP